MKGKIICLDSEEGSLFLKILDNYNWVRIYFKKKHRIYKIGAESVQFVFQSMCELIDVEKIKNKSWLSSENKNIFFGFTLAESHYSLHISFEDDSAIIYFENAQAQIFNQIKITKFELENWKEILKTNLTA